LWGKLEASGLSIDLDSGESACRMSHRPVARIVEEKRGVVVQASHHKLAELACSWESLAAEACAAQNMRVIGCDTNFGQK